MGKILFFDIDGTLIDYNGKMPASTRYALERARFNGHQIVICSGRARYQMSEELLAFADGMIGTTGANVVYQGKTIYEHFMPEDTRKKIYKVAAYITADGKTVTGDKSAKVSATTNPRTIRVKAYAYTGGGYTASGLKARRGLIAVDRNVIRLGTKVYVPGYGYAVAADTGGAIKGNIIDCYMNSMSDCTAWGVRFVTIRIYD